MRPVTPRPRPYAMFDPICPGSRAVTCGFCGWTGLASLDLDWYVQQAVKDTLAHG